MQVLLIGMDGVKAETFDRGWTPFIKSLIDEGNALSIKEDLVSRGWSEIMLGEHAFSTGAVYEGPLVDGTLTWSDKFKLDDVPGLGKEIKPIWQALNELGYRVGVMNVPTTFPAPEVNGFFVSGGGGGGPVSQDATPEQCHPEGLENWLKESDYILDERVPSLLGEQELYEPEAFFNRLDLMNQKRTEAFVQLAGDYEIDFGFVVFKSSTVTTETLLIPELEKQEEGLHGVNEELISAAAGFYRKLDIHIRSIVKSFPEAQVLLVSDHSMATRRYAVNPNAILVEMGLQCRSSGKQGIFRAVKSFKHLLPAQLKKRLKGSARIKSAYESMVTFDTSTTRAFSQSFSNGTHGIYINDQDRFGGPVDPDEINNLIDQIVLFFNEHPDSIKYGFRAYRKTKSEKSSAAKKFPDVVLDLPDDFQTSSVFPSFIKETKLPSTPFDLRDMKKDPRVVGKAHEALAVCVNSEWKLDGCDREDLTAVYYHVLNEFDRR